MNLRKHIKPKIKDVKNCVIYNITDSSKTQKQLFKLNCTWLESKKAIVTGNVQCIMININNILTFFENDIHDLIKNFPQYKDYKRIDAKNL